MFSFLTGWRTLTVAGIVTLLGTLQQADIVNVVGTHYAGVAISAIGLIMAVLRLNTSTPLGVKKV